eukprot:scaffold8211_cov117-Cylindrotheca_fusiformis.AAC.8
MGVVDLSTKLENDSHIDTCITHDPFVHLPRKYGDAYIVNSGGSTNGFYIVEGRGKRISRSQQRICGMDPLHCLRCPRGAHDRIGFGRAEGIMDVSFLRCGPMFDLYVPLGARRILLLHDSETYIPGTACKELQKDALTKKRVS